MKMIWNHSADCWTETTALVKVKIQNHIKEIQSTNCVLLIGEVDVKHKLKVTMIYGKTFVNISDPLCLYTNSGLLDNYEDDESSIKFEVLILII